LGCIMPKYMILMCYTGIFNSGTIQFTPIHNIN
jgi:hypothetical protein